MSGGSLNYFFTQLEDHVGVFGDKELDDLISDLAGLFKDREWYLSSDIGPGEWRESKERFKKKWFTREGTQERLEKYLSDLIAEAREILGLDIIHRCETCRHWKRVSDSKKYGRCDLESRCLMHQYEVCDEWEEAEE